MQTGGLIPSWWERCILIFITSNVKSIKIAIVFLQYVLSIFFRRWNLDSGSVGSPCTHRQEHPDAPGQAHQPFGLQTLRRRWNTRLSRQAPRPLQGPQVRMCPWSQTVPRIQEVNKRERESQQHLSSRQILGHLLNILLRSICSYVKIQIFASKLTRTGFLLNSVYLVDF